MGESAALVSYLAALALTIPIRLGRLLDQVLLGGADVNYLLLACVRQIEELLKVEVLAITRKRGSPVVYLGAGMAGRLQRVEACGRFSTLTSVATGPWLLPLVRPLLHV